MEPSAVQRDLAPGARALGLRLLGRRPARSVLGARLRHELAGNAAAAETPGARAARSRRLHAPDTGGSIVGPAPPWRRAASPRPRVQRLHRAQPVDPSSGG